MNCSITRWLQDPSNQMKGLYEGFLMVMAVERGEKPQEGKLRKFRKAIWNI